MLLDKDIYIKKMIFYWALTIPLTGLKVFGIAVSNIFIFFLLILFIYKGKYIINKKPCILFFWLISILFTSIVNVGEIPTDYLSVSVSMFFKLCIIFVLISLAMSYDTKMVTNEFLKGIYYCGFIQAFWILLELFFWYGLNIPLNEVLFGEILNIDNDITWLRVKDGLFRPSGIGWDSAFAGMSLLISFFLSKKLSCKIFLFICIILSTSRHVLIGLLIVKILDYIILEKNKLKIRKKSILFVSILLLLGIIFLGIIFNLYSEVIIKMSDRLLGILGLLVEMDMADSSSIRHFSYYPEMLMIFDKSNFLQCLFGWGTFVAGYPYSQIVGIYNYIMGAWTPESDFVTLFIGNGIIGGIIYYYIIFNVLKNTKKYNRRYFKVVLSILVCGFMYIFLRSVWPLEIVIILFLLGDNKDYKRE